MMPADLERDLEAYATLAARLAAPTADRRALLAEHDLDEVRWEALDEAWQARIFADDDGDGIPAQIVAYSDAYTRAQQAAAKRDLSFERFIEAALAVRRGDDIRAVLARLDLTLDDLLAAQRRWTAAMLADEALATRFERAMHGRAHGG